MASRFTQSMKAKERAFRHRQGMESLTTREAKFYRRKMNELPENHTIRMQEEAAFEQVFATEWWRRLARILQTTTKLDSIEWSLIRRGLRLGWTVDQTNQAIQRYRRLTERN
jgi:hypothetical protein